MAERSRRPRSVDLNRRAFEIVQIATGEAPPVEERPAKNPAAVALGRLGGHKGGAARAARMSPAERWESARTAAAARWKRSK